MQCLLSPSVCSCLWIPTGGVPHPHRGLQPDAGVRRVLRQPAGHHRDASVPAMLSLCSRHTWRLRQLWRECVPMSQVQVRKVLLEWERVCTSVTRSSTGLVGVGESVYQCHKLPCWSGERVCTSVTSYHVGMGESVHHCHRLPCWNVGECAPVSQVAMLEWWRVCTSVASCHARVGKSVHQCQKLPCWSRGESAPVSQVAV